MLLSFLKVKQGDNVDLLDYLSRFKTERNIVMQSLGKNLFDGCTHHLPGYMNAGDDSGRKAVKSKELDKFMVVLFLKNARHEIFGELLVEYRKELSAREVKYQAYFSTMIDAMIQHPIKKKKKATLQKISEK